MDNQKKITDEEYYAVDLFVGRSRITDTNIPGDHFIHSIPVYINPIHTEDGLPRRCEDVDALAKIIDKTNILTNKETYNSLFRAPGNVLYQAQYYNNTDIQDLFLTNFNPNEYFSRLPPEKSFHPKMEGILYCLINIDIFNPNKDYVSLVREKCAYDKNSNVHIERLKAVEAAINVASKEYIEAVSEIISRSISYKEKIKEIKQINIPIIITLWGLIPSSIFKEEKAFFRHEATGLVLHKGFGLELNGIVPDRVLNAAGEFKGII